MAAPSITLFEWEAGHTLQVFYVAQDRQVHELYKPAGASWTHAPTSVFAGTAAQVGSPYQLIGFAWEANRSKHVFFAGDDGRHELWVSIGDWQHVNLSHMFPDMPAAGYVWQAIPSKHAVFASSRGELSELRFKLGSEGWERSLAMRARLYNCARVFVASPSSPGGVSVTGYGWAEQGSQQIAFIGCDGHIHEWFTGRTEAWEHDDLTDKAGAPLPSNRSNNSFITGYAWEEGRTKQVLYFDDSGAIHELYRRWGEDWRWVNLTERTSAPRVSADRYHRMVGYGWGSLSTKQVVFIGDDRNVHEMYCGKDSDWAVYANLTSIAREANDPSLIGAPLAHPEYDCISACAWRQGESKQVVYVDVNNHVIELFVGLDGIWKFIDLTLSTSSPQSI